MVNPSSRFVPAVAALVVLAACSTGDGRDLDARVPASIVPTTVPADTSGGAPVASEVSDVAAPTLPPEPASDDAQSSDATAPSVVEVPELGVPGLDDDDAFCAAWSRFAGSFQVIAVNAAFGGGAPDAVAELEVLAAGTVDGAYAALGESWPAELDDERSAALDDSLGPFAQRVGGIADRLAVLGVDAEQQDAIDAAWLDALARRDPNDPTVAVALDPVLEGLVALAAAEHLAAAGSWFDDDTLVTSVATPATDVYLATNCPDQGTLAGQDAEG